jgi:hypothetical protein
MPNNTVTDGKTRDTGANFSDVASDIAAEHDRAFQPRVDQPAG